jgi:hypothetical protein
MSLWTKWLPWRFVIRHLARTHGFLDPLALLAQLRRFAQPSEVGEPVELLRAGMVFHARGLINSRVVQHNLDWVWPYWVERQFDPKDTAFVPRAFSLTHINLTHRNWTAIGVPDVDALPIVDPRGLLTPHFDGWSLDGWIYTADGRTLLPSRQPSVIQRLEINDDGVAIITHCEDSGLVLTSRAWVETEYGSPVCRLSLRASADSEAWLVLALRPYNPEGVSFIHHIALTSDQRTWIVDEQQRIDFGAPAERHQVSNYAAGDVNIRLGDGDSERTVRCEVGLASAAALFAIDAGETRELIATIPLSDDANDGVTATTWPEALADHCRLQCPDQHWLFLYDAALRTLVLHSPDDVYPGPYTYKRFWFRDAAFIIHALLCAGLTQRAERALDRFPGRQTLRGYFRSQEGEWDSNGEALWIMQRYCAFTGQTPKPAWRTAIERGARWIINKRLDRDIDNLHAGLLPAGFSAEHLGPNDYYYWDDFWGIAGLHAGAALLHDFNPQAATDLVREADDFQTTVDRSLARDAERLSNFAMPASPYRRLDAGAIGSLVMGYPLQLCPAVDRRLLDSVGFLREHCFVDGAFFQDMIHSGLNAYLTLHIAQVLLRAGDPHYLELVDTVAGLASPTGQWPEAIHPQTRGGCMGDGHHVWAAAEWVVMLRNCFVREEEGGLILCSGIPARWLSTGEAISFGPAPTAFGTLSLQLAPLQQDRVRISWDAHWHTAPPTIELRLPGFTPLSAPPGVTSLEVSPAP